MIFYYFINFY